jgi:predicted nucleotidyltransferase
MNEELAPLLTTLREVLRDRRDVHLALLFGSRARGRARPDSDIDLAVQGEGLDRLALARDLSLATGFEVDVVDLDAAGFPLLNALARDAVVVHQGRPGAAGRWLSHTLTELETDRPNYERMRDAYLRKLAEGAHG